AALCAMVAGMAIGETVSCIVGYLLYRKKTRRSLVSEPCKPGIFREIVKIALPCAFSGYLRSGIGMIEGILVPKGLQSYGLTPEQTLAALGKFEGMALPVLIFPATFLAVVSKLLVPEITAEHALGNEKNNIKTNYSTLKWTLSYGIFLAVFVGLFGKDLGMALYRDETCGGYLTILAPFIPILYADKVVDGIMKGYNRQLTTMKINLADTIIQTLGAWILIPLTGIGGYIALFCFGTVFNFSLSLCSLRKTCCLRFPFKEGVLEPFFFSLGAILPLKVLQNVLPHSVWITAALSILLFLLLKSVNSNNGAFKRSIKNWQFQDLK
ncbi:MAG: polysaccharide biosynthesis C-terminal domain-containing protein, partial [Clostridia bacterium]|nr:polysaccharide biosynthesis C-terminal domain-containing protein [Clostridia bacterium]